MWFVNIEGRKHKHQRSPRGLHPCMSVAVRPLKRTCKYKCTSVPVNPIKCSWDSAQAHLQAQMHKCACKFNQVLPEFRSSAPARATAQAHMQAQPLKRTCKRKCASVPVNPIKYSRDFHSSAPASANAPVSHSSVPVGPLSTLGATSVEYIQLFYVKSKYERGFTDPLSVSVLALLTLPKWLLLLI